MQIDTTINLGQIISIGGMIVAFIGAYYNLKGDIRSHGDRLTKIDEAESAQIALNTKMIEEMSAMRQDVAIIRDRIDRVTAATADAVKQTVTTALAASRAQDGHT